MKREVVVGLLYSGIYWDVTSEARSSIAQNTSSLGYCFKIINKACFVEFPTSQPNIINKLPIFGKIGLLDWVL